MAKSNRQRKQDRAKASAKKADQQRRKDRAEQERQWDAAVTEALDYDTPPDRLAELVAGHLADDLIVARIARLRLQRQRAEDEFDRDREPRAGEVPEAARLLIASTEEPRGIGVLAFAVVGAHADGDEEAEHRYVAELLDRCREVDDEEWLAAAASRIDDGHPGEAFALTREYLTSHPQDEKANSTFGEALEAVARKEEADRDAADSAALEQFADRSGWAGTRDAIAAFVQEGTWAQRLRLAEQDMGKDAGGADWTPEARAVYQAFVADAALFLTDDEDVDDEAPVQAPGELGASDREGPGWQTAFEDFALAPDTDAELAARAAACLADGRYGIWQVDEAGPTPGLLVTDLLTVAQRYAEFPSGILDGTGPWGAWLGRLAPVDGIWRAVGAGLWLSPLEADAVSVFVSEALTAITSAMLNKPLPDLHELDFDRPDPHGVLILVKEPVPPEFLALADSAIAATSAEAAHGVLEHRAQQARRRNVDEAAANAIAGQEEAWLDKPSAALDGQTPREASEAGPKEIVLLETLLRRIEFNSATATPAVDVDYLRAELDLYDPLEVLLDMARD